MLLSRYDLRSHVNLIPWNPVDDSPYERPSRNAVRAFADVLETTHRIPTSIRITRGAHKLCPPSPLEASKPICQALPMCHRFPSCLRSVVV